MATLTVVKFPPAMDLVLLSRGSGTIEHMPSLHVYTVYTRREAFSVE